MKTITALRALRNIFLRMGTAGRGKAKYSPNGPGLQPLTLNLSKGE